MGLLGPCPGHARSLGPPRAVDPLFLEGPLQRPCGGDHRGGEEPEEFDTDPSGAPGRVPPLELTGPADDVTVMPRSGPAAGPIADGEAIVAVIAEGPPEVADGGEGEVEIGRDPEQGLTVEVSADDLLAGGIRDGAGHDESSGVFGRKHPDILCLNRTRGYNFLSGPGS